MGQYSLVKYLEEVFKMLGYRDMSSHTVQPSRRVVRRATRLAQQSMLFVLALVVACGLVIMPVAPTTANAQACEEYDEQFFSGNDVLFYDPCTTSCSLSGSSGTGSVSSLRGDNNGQKIYNFWLDAGLNAQQSAGVTGSMKHEGGFSPFRQEMSQAWPGGGWGIAQFTHDPGQRGSAIAYVRAAIGEETFTSYYKNEYGGAVTESNGFIPAGVPTDVNDKFLLAQLNYLLEHIQELKPNNIRTGVYAADFNKTIGADVSLFTYLSTLTVPADAAIAWTYLYEYPGDIKATSLARGVSADEIFTLFSGGGGGGSNSACGGNVTAGGMNLEQAKAFMETYLQIDNGDPNGDAQYLSGACHKKTDNCVTFSSYFINKYTDLKFQSADGGKVVGAVTAANPQLEVGKIPQAYALFGTRQGTTICDDGLPCGHTGMILGVDVANDKVIVGEAAWCNPGFTGAREYSLSEWSDGTHTYAYTSGYIKADRKGDLK